MPATPRVLLICADRVGPEMAGVGIRAWELARVLRETTEVTLAHTGREPIDEEDLRTVSWSAHDYRAIVELIPSADVVIAQPVWSPVVRALRRSSARVIFDLYDPEIFELLELLSTARPSVRSMLTSLAQDRLHDALLTGHHFMCATESQRHLWLGAMLALRTIGPAAYDRDPSLRSVIDLVPFGVPEAPPRGDEGTGPRQLLRLAPGAEIVLWNGGIWQWLDPETAVRAIAALEERRREATLVFMGGAGGHPVAQRAERSAREVARELGVLGGRVIFHDGWVPYSDRDQWLAQAACGISAAHDHLETRFAFRTRVLDCLWARLPIACTSGDEMADRIAREDLGAVAAPGDAEGLAAAIESVLARGRSAFAGRLADAARHSTWTTAAQPLLRWVADAEPPVRPSDRHAVRPQPAQRARALAYRAGRPLLARHAERRLRAAVIASQAFTNTDV